MSKGKRKPAEYRAIFIHNGREDGEEKIRAFIRALMAHHLRKQEESKRGEWRKKRRKRVLTPPRE